MRSYVSFGSAVFRSVPTSPTSPCLPVPVSRRLLHLTPRPRSGEIEQPTGDQLSCGIRMRLAELQVALRAADSGAVLVPPRILEQIIQEARNLRGSVWSPPHRQCYVVERQTLFR